VTIVDARELDRRSSMKADLCIVGAGAAGITIASQLVGSPWEVCLIEGGGFSPDEATQSLYELECIGYPVRENFMSRARYYGGTCNLWAGRSMKLEPIDMAHREWVPGSGWPISYSELDRYYPEAARVLRLPSFDQFSGDTCRRMINGEELQLFSDSDFKPSISLWGMRALRFGKVYREQLKKARNVSVYLNANVTRLDLNDEGTRIETVTACTLNNKALRFKARYFVLACGGLENARLLLVSREQRPMGIGNEFDVVGRFFMDHPRAVFGQVTLHDDVRLPLLRGCPLPNGKVQIGIKLSEQAQRREGLLNHHVTFEPLVSRYAQDKYQSFVQAMKVLLRRGYAGSRWRSYGATLAKVPEMIYLLTLKELMPHFVYRWSTLLRSKLERRSGPRTFILVNFCEQPPNRESRVLLSHRRDRLNVNTLVLDWKIGPEVERTITRFLGLFGRHLQQRKIGVLTQDAADFGELSFSDASHHLGTTRMSDDPRLGVVDSHCRVHSVENLFIAGSSVFPSAGHANPTLTIVALALRLSAHLRAWLQE
jgi:choline dehydrogenase-like flavoprotein